MNIAMRLWPISPSSWKSPRRRIWPPPLRARRTGLGPAAALDAALEIAEGMGMTVTNCEGHIGFADLAGKTEKQLGIIGHVDVVPAVLAGRLSLSR